MENIGTIRILNEWNDIDYGFKRQQSLKLWTAAAFYHANLKQGRAVLIQDIAESLNIEPIKKLSKVCVNFCLHATILQPTMYIHSLLLSLRRHCTINFLFESKILHVASTVETIFSQMGPFDLAVNILKTIFNIEQNLICLQIMNDTLQRKRCKISHGRLVAEQVEKIWFTSSTILHAHLPEGN